MSLPFNSVPLVIKMVRGSARTVQDLIDKRETNKTFEEVIDEHIEDLWAKLVTNEDIEMAFRIPKLYLLEQILIAREWYFSDDNSDTFTQAPPVATEYIFQLWSANKDLRVDDVCLRYLDINTIFVVPSQAPSTNVRRMTILAGALDKNNSDAYERAKFLIEHGADVNLEMQWSDVGSIAPIWLARYSVELVKLLIDNGADVNFKGRFGTILFDASEDLAKYLLEDTDIDVNMRNGDGMTGTYVSFSLWRHRANRRACNGIRC